jgi:nucleoporin NDC1
MTCASLTEDRYGVVQKDIPKILEAMILLLSAVEEYKAEVVATSKTLSSAMTPKERVAAGALEAEIKKSTEALSYLEDGELIEPIFVCQCAIIFL